MSIGILGGTFDPPHVGHLLLAETAREQLGLRKVLFVPAGQPVHKPDRPVTSAAQRVEMTRLAIADNPHFLLDRTDIDRPPPLFTVTLLPLLREQVAGEPLWLLIGGDSLGDFLSWHRPEAIIDQCRLAVLPRPEANIDWDKLADALPGLPAAVTMLDGPAIAVSSTKIREWATAGRSLRYLAPPAVLSYIATLAVYR